MKTLALLGAVAATGLLAMSASAIPTGYESFGFHATFTMGEGSGSYKKVSISNKDLLNLIALDLETPPSGAQLVTRGLGYTSSSQFAVLRANGDFFENASASADTGGDYALWFYPEEDDEYVYTETGSTVNALCDYGYLDYRSYSGTYYIYFWGATKVTDNTDNSNESFSMATGSGYAYLPVDGGTYGILNGGVSGSGKDVDEYWW